MPNTGRLLSFCRLWSVLLTMSFALPAAAEAEDIHTVTFATVAFYVDGQIHYAEPLARVIDEGWLTSQLHQRGVELVWDPVQGDVGATINEAFSAHRIEFASYGDLPSIILNASGTRTQVVVPGGRGGDTYLLVPPSSSARSLADLKGQRIAVHRGRPWYLSFLRLVEQSGLKSSDFTLVNMDLQPSIAALASGNIDAMFTIMPYTTVEKGLAKIIWSSKGQIDKKIRGEVWGAKTFIDAHPDITQLIVTAYVRAQYWVADEHNREIVIQTGTLTGRSRHAVEADLDQTVAWKDLYTPVIDQAVLDHYGRVVAFAEEKHLVRTPLRAEELLQPKFVTTALRDLKLEHFWSQVPVTLQQ
jgi:sulfonate transport system substrate-binding protein